MLINKNHFSSLQKISLKTNLVKIFISDDSQANTEFHVSEFASNFTNFFPHKTLNPSC